MKLQMDLLLPDHRDEVGESPIWSSTEQALYWVDIEGRKLHRWTYADQHVQSWDAVERPACIALHAAGGLIAGMDTGVFHLQPQVGGTLAATLLAGVDHPQPGMRFNDGRCDRQGRLWAGTMCLDMAAGTRAGTWYRFAQGETALPAQISDFIVPNGLAFSPDGKTMYVSDSHPTVQQVWAFDYDTQSGTPSNRRLFIDMNAFPGRPDGAAMDVDGCYWICGNDAGLIHRFTPDGRLDKSLAVPVKKPAMCAFGGPQLDTLYVTSIRPGGDLSDQPLAGGVFALNAGVCGLPEPSFAV